MAASYGDCLAQSGVDVRRMDLADMSFDLNFEGYAPDAPPLEIDLPAWPDQILIVQPCCRGAMPSKAKAVLDCALTLGFGYKYHGRGMGWDKLL